jgi:AraC-like DNA-binding protein
MERGASRWAQAAGRQPFDANETTALISLGTETARLVTSDNSVRLQLCIPGSSLSRSLEAILERPIGDTVQFSNDIDWSRGGGASIRRLVCHVFAELSEPASLLGRGIGAAEFEGLLVQSLLLGLPHNYSARLGRQKAAAAPRNVWRAEEFLRANAKEPVTIKAVAQSAGCSVRALQLAFRRFRKTTPMEALRRIRLEEARQDIARLGGSQSVIEVAAKFGFSNPSRFASQYKRAFGEYPSEALHKRSLHQSSSRRAL